MSGFARLLERPWFHIMLLLSAIGLAIVHDMPLQYTTPDTLIYALVGKAIYRDGILPYGFAFDHKPFLTYFIYGPLSLIESRLNVFAIFSVFWLIILAWIAHTLLLKRNMPSLLVLFAMVASTYGNVSLTGNTEIVYVTFELLAVGLALYSTKQPLWFVLSAACAVAATSVNYISGLPLLPTLLYALYASSSSTGWFLWRALAYLAVSIAILAIAFGLLALGGADLGEYFALQRAFLAGYSGGRDTPELSFVATIAAATIGLLLPMLLGLAVRPQLQKLRIAMALLMGFSVISFFLSGKFFDHYAFMVTAPATIAVLTVDYSFEKSRALLSAALVAAAVSFLGLTTFFAVRDSLPKVNLFEIYEPLAKAVGDEPVTSIHSSAVPLYFSGLKPSQPLVWEDHAETIYGEEADTYYRGLLNHRPRFVITMKGWCDEGGDALVACNSIESQYEELLSQEYNWPILDYSLWRLKE